MSDVLAKIVDHKRGEVAAAKLARSLPELRSALGDAPPVRDFAAALAQPGTRIIAEVKGASPSAGVIREGFDPVRIASLYAECGAACISCLTDEKFFGGRLAYLSAIRETVPIPVLRKDFLIDPYQVYEARAAGADAVLLIAECLDDAMLAELYALTRELGMEALIEIYEPANLDRVLAVKPRIVGVNNRDLKTMVIDLGHSLSIRPRVPDDVLFVSESGIKERSDVEVLERAGVRCVLIGETLMRAPEPGAKLRSLLGQVAAASV